VFPTCANVKADAEAKTEIRSDTLSIRIGAESDCRTSTDDQVHHHAVEDHFAAGRMLVALAVVCVLVVGRTQAERITEVDRIPTREPVEIEPARQADRIFLREDTDRGASLRPRRAEAQVGRKIPRLLKRLQRVEELTNGDQGAVLKMVDARHEARQRNRRR